MTPCSWSSPFYFPMGPADQIQIIRLGWQAPLAHMCVSVSACMYVCAPCICLVPWRPSSVSDPLELEEQKVVSEAGTKPEPSGRAVNCSMSNKNSESDIGVQPECQKSKIGSHWLLPLPQTEIVILPPGISD